MQSFVRALQRVDGKALVAAVVLFIFGIAAMYSVELSRGTGDFVLLQKQAIALVLGTALAVVITRTNVHIFRTYGRHLYLLGTALLVLVLLFGAEFNGAKGWFVVGGFAFQPIEFMKLGLIAELARYFGLHAERRFGWKDFGQSALMTALPIGLAMAQPDLGGATLLAGIWLVMVFFAGVRWQQVATLLLAALVVALLGWFVVFHDYQRERIVTFLHPSSDPLDTGYNVTQATIAIGAGGFFGRGLGAGSQSQLRFLPQAQADFVFAVIAEELGFVGVAAVLIFLTLLLVRLLTIARLAHDSVAAFLVLGVFAVYATEAAVHVGANLAILPATGVALPFVSYGGTSLVLSCALLGIAQSVAMRNAPE